MDGSQRRRPWWHWALGAFVGLVILSAIFGADDEQPASGASGTSVPSAVVTTQTTPVETIADARVAADDERYAEAVAIARAVGAGAPEQIRRRIADRIARRAQAALTAGDRPRAAVLLAQAQRYPATARAHQARASLRAAQARAAARARERRAAAARRRSARAADRAARVARREAAKREAAVACDPNYAGACLKADSPDYDCAGGSGDGPEYTGLIQVVGNDHFDLDRDGDGTGCDR
ncbi:MAG TPA: hypothetical protein VGO80_12885 [Solirubrobacteraceae bacterium]|jgi:hypothetical protein|nr:hypothetical protein [Solirubrobacteraceae bacterium]